ncbi:uncharacterized protein LOC143449251 isoform X3 [Clavelina lepadiformis]|uniref:uncharacterized protein LOC143449251 isoform X3 n=1 Tax=Clavelina lepadiformis TaxID=159417 RepID=UPI004042FA7B
MYNKLVSRLKRGCKNAKDTARFIRTRNNGAEAVQQGFSHSSDRGLCDKQDQQHLSVDKSVLRKDEVETSQSGSVVDVEQILRNANSSSESSWLSLINSNNYKNWLKTSLALRFACDFVSPVLEDIVRKMHFDLLRKNGYQALSSMTSLKRKKVSESSLLHKWMRSVLDLHRHPPSFGEVLRVSDVTKWPTYEGAWEIAKVFMARGYRSGEAGATSPGSFDSSALLNFMYKCRQADGCVSDLQLVKNMIQDEKLQSHAIKYPESQGILESLVKMKESNLNINSSAKLTLNLFREDLWENAECSNPNPSGSTYLSLKQLVNNILTLPEANVSFSSLNYQLGSLEAKICGSLQNSQNTIRKVSKQVTRMNSELSQLRNVLSQTPSPEALHEQSQDVQQKRALEIMTQKPRQTNVNGNGRSSHLSSLVAQNDIFKHYKEFNSGYSFLPSNWKYDQSTGTAFGKNSFNKKLSPNESFSSGSLFSSWKSTAVFRGNQNKLHLCQSERLLHCHTAATFDNHAKGANSAHRETKRNSRTSQLLTLKRSASYGIETSDAKRGRFDDGNDKDDTKNRKINSKIHQPSSLVVTQDKKPFKSGGGGGGGSGSNITGMQEKLQNYLRLQGEDRELSFIVEKDASFKYHSTVKFISNYALTSSVLCASSKEAEQQAAVEALNWIGCPYIHDVNNAKVSFDNSCLAIIGRGPTYTTSSVGKQLHISLVQLYNNSYISTIGAESILPDNRLYLKECYKSFDCKVDTESLVAKAALEKLDVNTADVADYKHALGSICLAAGATLPVYETNTVSESGKLCRSSTVRTYIRDFLLFDKSREGEGEGPEDLSLESDAFYFCRPEPDIIEAYSIQPHRTQLAAEQDASYTILKLLNWSRPNLNACRGRYKQDLKTYADNLDLTSVFHTLQVKSDVDLVEMYKCVVSSSCLKGTEEPLSVSSDRKGFATPQEAKESAARNALIMLGQDVVNSS